MPALPGAMSSTRTIALSANVLGALLTHAWYRKHEPCTYAALLGGLVLVPALPTTVLCSQDGIPLLTAMFLVFPLFYAVLLASIVTYRLSPLHPLAKYPGPAMCKVSKFWSVWITSGGKFHIYCHRLHKIYGPVVRIGPNELSIVDKDLIPYILGNQGMPKGPLWDGRRITPARKGDERPLIACRNLKRHAQLRKPWNRSFSASAMNDYHDALMGRASQLIKTLEQMCRDHNGTGVMDIAKWISYFSFDFMGDMAFGGGFELMRDGDKDNLWHNMESGIYLTGLLQHIPWTMSFIRSIPVIGRKTQEFGAFAAKRGAMRLKEAPQRKDFFHHLMEASDADSETRSFALVMSNVVLTIIAGSDTTASVLSNLMYYLISDQRTMNRLCEEVNGAFPTRQDTFNYLDVERLASMPYLSAVINEALRLQPPVPSAIQRSPAVGSGGKMLGSMYIPEGTAVQVPPYSLHRQPAYFSPNAEQFWPERWLADNKSTPNVVCDRGAFIPFSVGQANCAGKSLAMLELRCMVALLVMHFDMSFDDARVSERWEESLCDSFVLVKGELKVKLRERGKRTLV